VGARPQLAPARRQVSPGVVLNVHVHRLQDIRELHGQGAQLVPAEERKRERERKGKERKKKVKRKDTTEVKKEDQKAV
jgi:hypothetical protein